MGEERMPLITNKTNFAPGDVPTAAELNAPYDSLQSVGDDIDGTNTATGWITWRHTEAGLTGNAIANRLYQYNNDTTNETLYNNTSYVTISEGGNPAQLSLGFTSESGECVRFHASGMVGESTVTTDYDYAGLPGGNKGKPNYYAFRLLLNATVGGAPTTINLGEWGYSFTTKKSGNLTSITTPTLSGRIHWQPFAFSAVYSPNSSITFNSVELQCKVYDNANSLSVERHQLYAVRAKR